jgi:hypothetical protein
MPLLKVLALIVVAVLLLGCADARIFKGSIKTKNNWQYVAKFCYNGNPSGVKGSLVWNIPSGNAPHRELMLYWDQPTKGAQGSWTSVYKNKQLTCAQKGNLTAAGGKVELYNNPSGTKDPLNKYNHYWWVVIADCSANSQSIPSYSITFTNHGGDQLSCDEQGTPCHCYKARISAFALARNFQPLSFLRSSMTTLGLPSD